MKRIALVENSIKIHKWVDLSRFSSSSNSPLIIACFLTSGLGLNWAHASDTLQSLSDSEMSAATGQALMSLSYISPKDTANLEAHRIGGDTGIGFYKLGLEAQVAINANIKKLQLGCGGVNGAGACDIDIDNFSLSGNQTATEDNLANRAERVQSDAIMNNPFLEFAIKNPDSASTRSVVGFRLSAESVEGMLTFGTENSQDANRQGIPNGINSLSGYMELNSASGVAKTKVRYMTQAIGPMTGKINICLVGGGGCFNNRDFSSNNYSIQLQQADASFFTYPALVNGKRQTSVSLLGEASISPIVFRCETPGDTCVTAVANAPIIGNITTGVGVIGVIQNLKANVTVQQSLGLIHKIPVNGNPFSLSLQGQNIQWPNAAAANIAQAGWWLAFEGGIDIGNISPSNDVDIPDETLRTVLPFVNTFLGANPPTCSVIGGTSCFGGTLNTGTLYMGPGNGAPSGTTQAYVPFPLVNQVLSAQSFVPNCYGTLKYC